MTVVRRGRKRVRPGRKPEPGEGRESRSVLASGELLFCGHHGRRNMTSLEKQALFIQDETSRLTADG